MLTIKIDDIELFDNVKQEFVLVEGGIFKFEHTLKAVSEWESDWKVPFFTDKLTEAHLISYFKYMCFDEIKDYHLTSDVVTKLSNYIQDPRTATQIKDDSPKSSSQVLTSEIIYSMMASGQVPFDCENWNLNRLLTLLRVISIGQSKPKSKSKNEILRENSRLNAERKKKYQTKG